MKKFGIFFIALFLFGCASPGHWDLSDNNKFLNPDFLPDNKVSIFYTFDDVEEISYKTFITTNCTTKKCFGELISEYVSDCQKEFEATCRLVDAELHREKWSSQAKNLSVRDSRINARYGTVIYVENSPVLREEYDFIHQQNQKELELAKKAVFVELYDRCINFGFENKADISRCIQQEVFNEKRLAILKANTAATPIEKKELGFLEQVLLGVNAQLSNPNTWEIAKLKQELRGVKNSDIYRLCRPNC
tara:strand:+ start:133 stop:876 length:744 start_codon:yes stop_codon:yes gene_type:complete